MSSIKKQVGIITYHNAINYGAVLQAYALNKRINSFGIACDTIDYQCPGVDFEYRFRSWKKSYSWKNFFAQNLTCFFHAKKKKNFKKFREKIVLSDVCTRDTLNKIVDSYDVFITGSDQVFNPVCHKNDPTYFLDFVNGGRKVGYAVSLGAINQFERSKLNTWELLKKFDRLSFREKEATKYVSEHIEVECTTVMDPVWLLSKQEWNDIAEHNVSKPYIFVYNLMDYKYMKKFVSILAKQTGLPVISASKTVMGDIQYLGLSKNASNCSPSEFLGYIRDAEYIVTDSFHGTSLSILFEKKFFVAMNPSKNNTNSRMNNILEMTGLENRIIDNDKLSCNMDEINYEVVRNKTRKAIEFSTNYLHSICSIDS